MPLCLGHLVVHGHLVVATAVMVQQWFWNSGTFIFTSLKFSMDVYWIWWWMVRPRCLLVQWNFGPWTFPHCRLADPVTYCVSGLHQLFMSINSHDCFLLLHCRDWHFHWQFIYTFILHFITAVVIFGGIRVRVPLTLFYLTFFYIACTIFVLAAVGADYGRVRFCLMITF